METTNAMSFSIEAILTSRPTLHPPRRPSPLHSSRRDVSLDDDGLRHDGYVTTSRDALRDLLGVGLESRGGGGGELVEGGGEGGRPGVTGGRAAVDSDSMSSCTDGRSDDEADEYIDVEDLTFDCERTVTADGDAIREHNTGRWRQ